eukprot:403364391
MLSFSNLVIRDKQIQKRIEEIKSKYVFAVMFTKRDIRFMRLKTAAITFQRYKNQHNCTARELFPKQKFDENQQQLSVHISHLMDTYAESASDHFLSIMLQDTLQCIQTLEQPNESDQVLNYLQNLRQVYEAQPIEMKSNNKLMDLLFTSHSLFIEAIPQSRVYCDQIIEAMVSYLEEIAIPFYLSQNFINKDSLFKVINFIHKLVDAGVAEIGNNKMLLGRFQKVRATIEEKVKQLPQSQDGISLICEMFDQNDLIIKLKDQISDESKTNMRYLYDKIGSQQKQISEQIFEGKVHNYIGHMLQLQKLKILKQLNIDNQIMHVFIDNPLIESQAHQELFQYQKLNIPFYQNYQVSQLLEKQSQEAMDKYDFNGYIYWANELVDLSLKKMDVQMFLNQFILLTNFLCDSGFNEECIKICKNFTNLYENDKELKVAIDSKGYSQLFCSSQRLIAICYRSQKKLELALKHIQEGMQSLNEITQQNPVFSSLIPQLKMVEYNILLDLGQLNENQFQDVLEEADNAISLAQQSEDDTDHALEVKNRILAILAAIQRKRMYLGLGISFIASTFAVLGVLWLNKKKNQ